MPKVLPGELDHTWNSHMYKFQKALSSELLLMYHHDDIFTFRTKQSRSVLVVPSEYSRAPSWCFSFAHSGHPGYADEFEVCKIPLGDNCSRLQVHPQELKVLLSLWHSFENLARSFLAISWWLLHVQLSLYTNTKCKKYDIARKFAQSNSIARACIYNSTYASPWRDVCKCLHATEHNFFRSLRF